MGALDLLILAIATWRVSYLVTKEDAPFRLAARLRERHPLGGLTTCIYCASAWAAIALYVLWWTPLQPMVTITAIAGGAMMLMTFTGANHG